MADLRSILSYAFGFATWIGVGLLLRWLGDGAGVITTEYLDGPVTVTRGSGPASYDEEIDSYPTFYGSMTLGLSFVIALWAGRAIYAKSVTAGFSREDGWSFLAWLLAFSILSATAILIDLAFRQFSSTPASYIRFFVEIAAAAGVGWSVRQWWKLRTISIDD